MTIPSFFSYAQRDWRAERTFIPWLVDILEAQARAAHGSDAFHLWRDETGLRWGNDWPSRLHEQIGKTELFFVLLSPSWIKSDICRDELTVFLEREKAQGWTERVFVAQIRDIPADDPEIDDGMKALRAIRVHTESGGAGIRVHPCCLRSIDRTGIRHEVVHPIALLPPLDQIPHLA